MMDSVRLQAEALIGDIEKLQAAADSDGPSGGLTLGEAMMVQQAGVRDVSLVSSTMKVTSEPQVLGSGAIYTVFIANVDTGDGVEQRVLKPIENRKPNMADVEVKICLDKNDLRIAAVRASARSKSGTRCSL